MKALDVSKYILTKCNLENNPISNLQLQKTLYYIQYEFLTKMDKPLFEDDFEAWKFGPVIPSVYYEYSHIGAFKIGANYENYDSILKNMSSYETELLNSIIEDKRTKDAWFLVDDTHKKGNAWDLVFKNGIGFRDTISKKQIKENAF
ncbi:prophage ps3 protein 01 [Campylobacter sputorum subsp. bubulus]|uniref:Prophage ps3 protein 01 n=1 Tax=Campylobacter sputorum subsp. sputorum TaxID=32024 RepID=A0A381DL84_9BACT|nr:type II toxin-antitoxin system antitoxin SocA domain-containing protein [Campylobacter sputorum]ASM34650.1 DUF4065 domain protein [Campylobacter sputorum aubsp. sputorum RM3237]ASM36313.1 DUF4065 domain protein [Campylobacter sputorum bv. faecalis CCUG 20703]KAB0581136.1 DUF4065 domain-containing protein [Campylobacter sputorum subsp. sputorum]QEL04841.1 DUF4065 domain-containing protein [Campylobacter sputorum subsp. sputorum]SUX09850.1 prophage ps3 protein 01 [Campylobacter sputorum subsp